MSFLFYNIVPYNITHLLVFISISIIPTYLNKFSKTTIKVLRLGRNEIKNGPQNVISKIYKNKKKSQNRTNVL